MEKPFVVSALLRRETDAGAEYGHRAAIVFAVDEDHAIGRLTRKLITDDSTGWLLMSICAKEDETFVISKKATS